MKSGLVPRFTEILPPQPSAWQERLKPRSAAYAMSPSAALSASDAQADAAPAKSIGAQPCLERGLSDLSLELKARIPPQSSEPQGLNVQRWDRKELPVMAERAKLTPVELDAIAIVEFLRTHRFDSVNMKRRSMFKYKYPLHTAVKYKDTYMIRLLLAVNADRKLKNSSGETPLEYAAGLFATDRKVLRRIQKAFDDVRCSDACGDRPPRPPANA